MMREYKLRKKASKIIAEKTNRIHFFQSCRDLPTFDEEGKRMRERESARCSTD
jgi:hypothetical protein